VGKQKTGMTFETDAAAFRRIMGHYPTGVCAITGMSPDGTPVAMIVGSFTSVSLEPIARRLGSPVGGDYDGR
jgi:flavin reductase (DIM6/NTAB) family NADH-FMN oxidoreductase RutF